MKMPTAPQRYRRSGSGFVAESWERARDQYSKVSSLRAFNFFSSGAYKLPRSSRPKKLPARPPSSSPVTIEGGGAKKFAKLSRGQLDIAGARAEADPRLFMRWRSIYAEAQHFFAARGESEKRKEKEFRNRVAKAQMKSDLAMS